MTARKVKLLCVGRLREHWFIEAMGEYEKRLNAFCRFQTEEVPEQRLSPRPGHGELIAALEREADALEKRFPSDSGTVTVAFCVEGKLLGSEELAQSLGRWINSGHGSLCFLIGGSNGLAERLKQRADLCLSVSRMTFPHHLFRVMAAEQIYRAFSILEGRQYHK